MKIEQAQKIFEEIVDSLKGEECGLCEYETGQDISERMGSGSTQYGVFKSRNIEEVFNHFFEKRYLNYISRRIFLNGQRTTTTFDWDEKKFI